MTRPHKAVNQECLVGIAPRDREVGDAEGAEGILLCTGSWIKAYSEATILSPLQHPQPATRVQFAPGTLFLGAASLWTC